MIPKIIHYCWFGRGKKPELAIKCIESWKKYCPDYQIIEWNEDNYDFTSAPLFVQQAMKKECWAFASDYIRYQVVFEYGGIYFDTDVELLKNLDPFLSDTAFFGFESQRKNIIASGLGFGAEKACKFLQELMEIYKETAFVQNGNMDFTPNNSREQSVYIKHGLIPNGENQLLDNQVRIYGKEYFSPIHYETRVLKKSDKTVSIHWYSNSWKVTVQNAKQKKETIRKYRKRFHVFAKIGKTILGVERYERLKIRILNYLS